MYWTRLDPLIKVRSIGRKNFFEVGESESGEDVVMRGASHILASSFYIMKTALQKER